jgi:hypothetical protein
MTMGSKLATIFGGLAFSVMFGTAGGVFGGGLVGGLFGIVGGVILLDPAATILGAMALGLLGGWQGAFVGMLSGAIGWLPAVLFREFPRMSYFATVLLGTMAGPYVCLHRAMSHDLIGGLWSLPTAIIMASSISAGISANFMLRRWLVYIPYDGQF